MTRHCSSVCNCDYVNLEFKSSFMKCFYFFFCSLCSAAWKYKQLISEQQAETVGRSQQESRFLKTAPTLDRLPRVKLEISPCSAQPQLSLYIRRTLIPSLTLTQWLTKHFTIKHLRLWLLKPSIRTLSESNLKLTVPPLLSIHPHVVAMVTISIA